MDYSFTRSFTSNFCKNLGYTPNENDLDTIRSVCNTTKPFLKIDDKGRNSAYFTFTLNTKLVTVVADSVSYKIITIIYERYKRSKFKKLIRNDTPLSSN